MESERPRIGPAFEQRDLEGMTVWVRTDLPVTAFANWICTHCRWFAHDQDPEACDWLQELTEQATTKEMLFTVYGCGHFEPEEGA